VSDAPASAALVWCPFPDASSARTAIGTLLDEGLIACANILGPVESHFVWNGARATSTEVGVLCKTVDACVPFVIERLGALHPYDTPAIMGWLCDAAHPASVAWLTGCCTLPGEPMPRRAED
jgi:periplasmic divalent cation tolerance protein